MNKQTKVIAACAMCAIIVGGLAGCACSQETRDDGWQGKIEHSQRERGDDATSDADSVEMVKNRNKSESGDSGDVVDDKLTMDERLMQMERESDATSQDEQVSSEALESQRESDLSANAIEFDTQSAWSLSNVDKVNPVIGDAVAGSVMADLNDYLVRLGVSQVDDAADILVDVEHVSTSNDTTTFMVLANSGRERIVINCEYESNGTLVNMSHDANE